MLQHFAATYWGCLAFLAVVAYRSEAASNISGTKWAGRPCLLKTKRPIRFAASRRSAFNFPHFQSVWSTAGLHERKERSAQLRFCGHSLGERTTKSSVSTFITWIAT